MNDLARNPLRRVTGKESNQSRRILWLPKPSLWEVRQKRLPVLFCHPAAVGGAGINGVDRDATRGYFSGQGDGEGFDSPLARDIGKLTGHWASSLARSQVDDAPARCASEASSELDAQEQRAPDIDGIVGIKHSGVQYLIAASGPMGGVIDENRGVAQPRLSFIQNSCRCFCGAQINLQTCAAPAQFLYLALQASRAFLINSARHRAVKGPPMSEKHICAVGGQRTADRCADTLASAGPGHNSNVAMQIKQIHM